MITTRESINYQFSLIYGYSSPNHENLLVGNIISPGNLTKDLIKDLSKDVIKYLSEYNAMLRDYTGSELYAIEFELVNLDEKGARTKIFPKSMILIPGNYKECESLMLALKPETGYLNLHKSSKSINSISQLFFEVEEYANHPELEFNERKQVYNSFAQRFSQKLYGELLEEKWNKKLIGLSESLPTDQDHLNVYGKLKSKIEINWHKKPLELNFKSIDFEKINNPFDGKTAIEHLKFNITEPSAGFIAEKTLKLGTNLLNLANYGTIDEFQDIIIKYILNRIDAKRDLNLEKKPELQVISIINDFLQETKKGFEEFSIKCQSFLTTGEKGDLKELLMKLKLFLEEKIESNEIEVNRLFDILKKFVKKIIFEKENIRANDFNSSFNYFNELINKSFETIQTNLPRFLLHLKLKQIIQKFIKNLRNTFKREQEPAKLLAYRFIEKLRIHLLKIIQKHSLFPDNNINFEKKIIQKELLKLISNHLDEFFKNVELGVKEIISFAQINLGEEIHQIRSYIHNFKSFSGEIHFLLSYILRYSTINRFLKEIPDKDISDPVSFSTKFHRFLEKRLAGINLRWKSIILEWIEDYAKLFFNLDTKREWTLSEIYNDFINYLEGKEHNARKIDNFSIFLDTFISKIKNEDKRKILMKFYDQYNYFSGIKTEFPKYLRSKIEEELKNLNQNGEMPYRIEFISNDNNNNNFYGFLRENELKYFSDLIPIPLNLILKHKFTKEELDLFTGDLYQVFNFKYWGENNIAFNLSDNFDEVYREWIKEL